MLEKDIVKKILDHLKKTPECYAIKVHGGMYSSVGVPDILCCYKSKFIGFEVKRETGTATPLQQKNLDKINAAGGVGIIVTSVEDVILVLDIINKKGECLC